MEFQLSLPILPLQDPIRYPDKVLLVGSCFTEHIGERLSQSKFEILQNPNGILFDPYSVTDSLGSYIDNRKYEPGDLFFMNEVWQSWRHHGRFSHTNPDECLHQINESQQEAHSFLQSAKWLIITLGSSYSYRLVSSGQPVANCHRAPSGNFTKHMMSISETTLLMENCIQRLFEFNPGLQIIFTISPVRHARDGIVENNRSKARLIEAVHSLCALHSRVHYFPAYELVIDVLRDYRFYDIDLVHPNFMATEYVMQRFAEACVDNTSRELMNELLKIANARRHKPFQPDTGAHREFLRLQYEKTASLKKKYPYLNLSEELNYFSLT